MHIVYSRFKNEQVEITGYMWPDIVFIQFSDGSQREVFAEDLCGRWESDE